MTNPVPGRHVTTPYGRPGSWAAGYHTGDDYAAPQGTTVVAARTGRLVSTGWAGSYGNQVVLDTGGITHSYNHLSVIHGLGGTVHAGQPVGLVGSTGNSTGPHLHYEERYSPYGYWQHRKPQFNHLPDEEDDMDAGEVWDYPVADDFGKAYAAEVFLRRVPRVAAEVVSYRLELPDGTKADLWTVLVDTLQRVKRMEATLPAETVSYRLNLPDGSQADLWTVLVDTLQRVKRIEARLND